MQAAPQLDNLHSIAHERFQKACSLQPVDLLHPLPERSLRALGLVKIDGRVYSSEKFLRVLILNISIARLRGVRTLFLGTRPELDLPVFSTEVILMGGKRMFFLDVQRRGGYDNHDDSALYNTLLSIQDRYRDLFAEPLKQTGEILKTFSPAACYMKIKKDQDRRALDLFNDYLAVFLDLVNQARPLVGDALVRANRDYETYTGTVLDHDPAARVYRILFGKRGGAERVLELFFGRTV